MTGKSSSFSNFSSTYNVTAIRLVVLFFSIFETEIASLIENVVFTSVLVDPAYTYLHVREAWAIQGLVDRHSPGRFQAAYAFPDTIRLPPLLLAFCEAILCYTPLNEKLARLILGLLLTTIDFYVARSLETLAQTAVSQLDDVKSWEESLQSRIPDNLQAPLSNMFGTHAQRNEDATSKPLLQMSDLPRFVSQLYYSSPVIIMSTAYGCFKNLQTLLLVQALLQSALPTGSVVSSSLCLAVAAYMDIHCALMLVPMTIWMGRRSIRNARLLVTLFLLFSMALQWMSLLLVGSESYRGVVVTTHLHSFSFVGLQPSLSTLWYLSMELFRRFRRYFTLLLGGVPYIMVMPLTVRLYRYPFVLVSNDCFW
jgi:hypothetical protein